MISTPFLLTKQDTLFKVSVINVTYVKAEGRYTTIQSTKGEFLTQLPLKKWKELLPKKEFVQVSRNTLLQIECINKIIPKDNLLLLEDGTQHNIGRHYKADLLAQFVKVI